MSQFCYFKVIAFVFNKGIQCPGHLLALKANMFGKRIVMCVLGDHMTRSVDRVKQQMN